MNNTLIKLLKINLNFLPITFISNFKCFFDTLIQINSLIPKGLSFQNYPKVIGCEIAFALIVDVEVVEYFL